jgi:TetR/AcrR family transcriptional repressor of nem operon
MLKIIHAGKIFFYFKPFGLFLHYQFESFMGKAEITRQFIIETAAPIFNEKGIAGTSIDDVLKATKVAKGCLYGHFASKEELSHAMVDHLLQKVSDHTAVRLGKEDTAEAKLLAFLDLYRDPLCTLASGGCPIINFGVESDDTNPAVRQKIKEAIQRSIKMLSSITQYGIDQHEFSSAVHPEDFAVKMFALIEGGIMISRVTGSNKYMISIINSLTREIEDFKIT